MKKIFRKKKAVVWIAAIAGMIAAFGCFTEKAQAAGFSGMTFYHRFLINCWGDSMTAGQGGSGVSYPRVLKELTGFPVNNFGVSGENTYEIVDRSAEYGDQSGDIMIIEMGDNGTWSNMDDLIEQYQNMLDEADCSNYIIISSTDDPNDTDQIWGESDYEPGMQDTWYEAALKDAFGEHVVTARKYLIENGLSINGLDETDEDRERAEKGLISLQLRNYRIDNTHLNGYGYRAQAYAVYEKGIELGYWFANGGDVTSDSWVVVEDDVIQADYTGMAYPSRFMLVCAMNPCKCGWYGHPSGRCRCTERDVRRYHSKISGPLLDRIDLIVEVPALDYEELSRRSSAEQPDCILRRN